MTEAISITDTGPAAGDMAAVFAGRAADLRADIERHIGQVLDWVDQAFADGNRAGVTALAGMHFDLHDGEPFSVALGSLLAAADNDMTCARTHSDLHDGDTDSKECLICYYGRTTLCNKVVANWSYAKGGG